MFMGGLQLELQLDIVPIRRQGPLRAITLSSSHEVVSYTYCHVAAGEILSIFIKNIHDMFVCILTVHM